MHRRGSMTERYDKGSGGSGFTMGLVVGVTFGAVAAMLFAPKSGSETRRDLADSAGDLRQAAKDRWENVSEAVSSAVDKGRETYDQVVGTMQAVAHVAEHSVDAATDAGQKTTSDGQASPGATPGGSGMADSKPAGLGWGI
jgi:gas vesicle protein